MLRASLDLVVCLRLYLSVCYWTREICWRRSSRLPEGRDRRGYYRTFNIWTVGQLFYCTFHIYSSRCRLVRVRVAFARSLLVCTMNGLARRLRFGMPYDEGTVV